MPSSYERGRSSEYYVKQMLESMGYQWIIRSAASHSPIDLLASNGSFLLAIQVKARGYLDEDEKRSLIEWANYFKAKPMLAFKKKERWTLKLITYNSPKKKFLIFYSFFLLILSFLPS
ncbi:MAG: hypothetical protein QXM29_01920 [Nitrososphaerales archaeon]